MCASVYEIRTCHDDPWLWQTPGHWFGGPRIQLLGLFQWTDSWNKALWKQSLLPWGGWPLFWGAALLSSPYDPQSLLAMNWSNGIGWWDYSAICSLYVSPFRWRGGGGGGSLCIPESSICLWDLREQIVPTWEMSKVPLDLSSVHPLPLRYLGSWLPLPKSTTLNRHGLGPHLKRTGGISHFGGISSLP